MTEIERRWIDNATYEQLLAKVRFEPIGSPWMVGDTGKYFMDTLNNVRENTPDEERVRASKAIGWGNES